MMDLLATGAPVRLSFLAEGESGMPISHRSVRWRGRC